MDIFFVLLTQIINLTLSSIDFEVVHHPRRFLPVPKVRAGKTRYVKTSRVRRRIAASNTGWKIRVLLDGEFTGLELDPTVMIYYVRVVFWVEAGSNVLCVDGVREIVGFKDLWLRHRYFGCTRNCSWNSRIPVSIDRSDSEKATKNRKGHCQRLVQKSSSPQKECLEANKRNPPTVEETLKNKTVKPTSMKKDDQSQPPVRSGEHWPRMKPGEGVRLRDVVLGPLKPRNGLAIGQKRRVRYDEESPAIPQVRPREQVRPRDVHKPPKPRRGIATCQQAKLRDDEPMIPQVMRKEGDVPRPMKPSNLQRGGMATGQQASFPSPQVRSRAQVRPVDGPPSLQQTRLRNDEPSARGPQSTQVRSGQQVRTGDFADQPQRPSSLQRGGVATRHQARLIRDDEAWANAGEMDSFVRGILLVFALTVCVLMKFVLHWMVTNVLN